MEMTTEFQKSRLVALTTWAALLVIGIGLAVYFRTEVRKQEQVAADRAAEIEKLHHDADKLGTQLAAQKNTAPEQNKKLREALQRRLDDAAGTKLSAEDEKLVAHIRELLAEPAGGDEQNVKLRTALSEAVTAAQLRDARAINAAIEREVEVARGLKFQKPVAYHTMKVGDFPAFVRKEIRAQYTEEEFRDYGRALAFLGLLPEGKNLEELYLSVLGEQVGAFYDEKKQRLVTFSDKPSNAEMDYMILAHELTHALDDQNFPLKDMGLNLKDNDDRVRAVQSLIEGNATMAMGQVFIQKYGAKGFLPLLMASLRQNTEQFSKAPPFIQQSLIFPYMQGQQFVLALQVRGGNEAVDAAYKNPPISTEQILHPEKYFANEKPKEIILSNLAQVHGWKLLSGNVVGEMGMQLLVGAKAAAGWNGDRYIVWEVAPNRLAMFWESHWDSQADAEEFEVALIEWSKKNGRNMSVKRNSQLRAVSVIMASDAEILETLKK